MDLKCNLCGNTDGITHIMTPIQEQEFLFNGKHIHLCNHCVSKNYRKVLKDMRKIDTKILRKIIGKEKYHSKIVEYHNYLVEISKIVT